MAIFKGKTVNEATEQALKELQVDKQNVDINVLQEPSKGIFGVFEKEAEIEVIVLSDDEIMRRAKKKKREKLLYIAGCSGLALITILGIFFAPQNDESTETDIKTPASSKDLVGENYKTVVSKLEAAGFSNVKTQKLDDLIVGLLTKDGEVETVLIGSDDDFAKGERFDKDIKIIVSYHTFAEKETTTVTSSEMVTQTPRTTEIVEQTKKDQVLTLENNAEFAAILNSDNGELAKQFSEKYMGLMVEFDGHIMNIMPHDNYKTRYDILIFGGDYSGTDSTSYHGVNLQFFDVATVAEAFDSLDGLSVGQNLHIKARVIEYNEVSGVLRLEPVLVTAR
ncbi:DUF4839 domain-containing protein [Streptococcus hillyeri]|nr:DUF4839 domain-containing protein [Streptococcus hillyeri]